MKENIYLVTLKHEDSFITSKFLGQDETIAISNAQLYFAGELNTEPEVFRPIEAKLLSGGEANEIQNRNHGGKRPGAGAKKTTPVGAKRRALAITDTEYAEVKKLIKQLRSK